MAIDLSDYNTVPERLAEAKLIYPDGRFQSRIVELPEAFAAQFVAVEAKFYRNELDTVPAVGLAWESVPGKTPYTRDSELMNAETSAWGRALVAALAADAKKGIASREEIEARQALPQTRQRSGMKRTPTQVVDHLPGAVLDNPENHRNGLQSHLTVDQAAQLARIKTELVGRLDGNRQEARRLWEGTLSSFSLMPGDPIPADMIGPLEHAVKALLIKGDDE